MRTEASAKGLLDTRPPAPEVASPLEEEPPGRGATWNSAPRLLETSTFCPTPQAENPARGGGSSAPFRCRDDPIPA